MRLHVLVEGESEAALLRPWLKRLLPRHVCKVYPHQGKGKLPRDSFQAPNPTKEQLLDLLPAKLRAFGKELDPATDRVLVLLDLDDGDCLELKGRLTEMASQLDPRPAVLFRIAIEETEAFYMGDPIAIRAAFPKARINRLKNYEQDSICGTWELFGEVIGARVEDKVGWAERMAPHLGTEWQGGNANRSPSFRQLCKGFYQLAGELVD